MAEQHSSEAKLIRCIISKNGLKERALGSDMIAAFDVFESLESPFMAGSLTVSDSKNFINDYPIQGGGDSGDSGDPSFPMSFAAFTVPYSLASK